MKIIKEIHQVKYVLDSTAMNKYASICYTLIYFEILYSWNSTDTED